jgi:uncharacterized protein (TIGR02246 family)
MYRELRRKVRQEQGRLHDMTGTTAKTDEQAIRDLVDAWLEASKKGDTATILNLMTDDVIFMVPGQEQFGKEAFQSASDKSTGVLVEAISDIQEIKVVGDWAWMRNHLKLTIAQPNGKQSHRAGYVLTILRKAPDGRWAIARDANLLTEAKDA